MRVSICQNVEIQADVTITHEDICTAIHEMLDDCISRRDGSTAAGPATTTKQRQHALGKFVSGVYQCLQGVTDNMIAELTDANREIIANALLAQADRFSVKSIMPSESDGDA